MDIFDLFDKIKTTPAQGNEPVSYLIVGLGNPGKEYERTRHNMGFMALDEVAKKFGITVDRAKFHAMVGEGTVGGRRVLLMKPQTYMNNSGEAVGEAANFYKIPADHVIVLHDEISFAPGLMRVRRKGSAGGHNGLKSIIAHLSSEEFPRLKIGVGAKPNPAYDLADWVLSAFSEADMKALRPVLDIIPDAVSLIVAGKIDECMMKYSK